MVLIAPGVRVVELKVLPQYFEAIQIGIKTFEIRKNDVGFKEGDVLNLREWNPDQRVPDYTGQDIIALVTYVTDFEQKPGYVVMAIKVMVGAQ